MSNCAGSIDWDMDLTPRSGAGASFRMRLRQDVAGNLTGDIFNLSGAPIPGASVRSGVCLPGTIANPDFTMSVMTLELDGIPFGRRTKKDILLTGTVLRPRDNPVLADFGGTYLNRAEPGDTGTGGGGQTPRLRSRKSRKQQQSK